MSTPPLVYIAGPFSAPTTWDIAENVRNAERWGLRVAQAGGMPVIPHANTHLFHGQLDNDFWYAGTLALMRACQGVVLCPGWWESKGSRAEAQEATRLKIPILVVDGTEDSALIGGVYYIPDGSTSLSLTFSTFVDRARMETSR